MNDIKFIEMGNGQHAFAIAENSERIAEMIVGIQGKELSVFHTEVAKQSEGKGIGKKLVDAMTGYAREHKLKVIPVCPYVHAQYKRHPELYADIWKKEDREV